MDDSLTVYPIHDNQHGFMRGRSTESAISMTTNYIEKFLAIKEHCLAVFLDISVAFDSIDINHVKKALLKHGGDPAMVHWYHNYLSHRNLYADLHQEEASCSTGVGFPQGGVCSARFWLIAFNQAIKIINKNSLTGVGYADDCCILLGGTNQYHMVTQIQRAVNKLITWGNTCGLRFNHSKTVAVLFTSNNKKFYRHIRIDNNDIPYSSSVRYLGLILDSKLNWNLHIKQKALACKRFLYMVARITKDSFGPSPKIMRWTYLCVVRPMMCYGALCWAHMAEKGANDKILRNLNRAGMNLYSNFPRSSPTRTVEIITDTLPLALQAQKVGLSARIRLKNMIRNDWPPNEHDAPTSGSHVQFWDQLIFDSNLEKFMEQDDSIDINLPFTNFTVATDSFSGESKYLCPSQLNIFTDGSKLNNKVGSGVHVTSQGSSLLDLSFRLPDHSTVFQAEIFAINQAAIAVLNMPNFQFIKFFVDSQAALLALNNKHVTSRLVGDTIHNLNLISGHVRLVWIKAHVGHLGNEKADELAKVGTTLSTTSAVALPKQATKQAIKEAVDEIWNLQWTQYSDGRQSKQFYPLPNRTKAKYSYQLNRQELGRLIRIVTGHNNLFYHRSNIDRGTSPLCRFCREENETFYHFATNCPCFRLSRYHYFQDETCFSDGKWSIRKLIDFSNIPSISAALGGNFDPHVHLEYQRDLEDIIEAEQDDADLQLGRQHDADLQPGRQHDPDQPIHTLSTSTSDSDHPTQCPRLQAIIDARHQHPLSSSSSDTHSDQSVTRTTSPPLPPRNKRARLTNDDTENLRRPLEAEAGVGGPDSDDGTDDPTRPSEAVEGVEDPDSLGTGPDVTNYNRSGINYDNFELTDDEYLCNETDDD